VKQERAKSEQEQSKAVVFLLGRLGELGERSYRKVASGEW